ncbi:MAG: hypothetical protein GY854_33620 [Deltaproteobacteria bacterium]|nr:hypothetical protein [Deltaproteobacteria bacterium]
MHLFEQTGTENTGRTIDLAVERAGERGINSFIVATTSGRTGLEAARLLGRYLVVVTHSTGFSKPGVQEIDPLLLEQIQKLGATVLTATHAFGGVGRAVRRKFNTFQVDEIIAQTLRIFGEGTKVAVEMATMAADAGLVPIDKDIVAIAGTGRGADTAVILQPAHTQDLFAVKIREIICKPYL